MASLVASPVAAQPKRAESVLVLEATTGAWKEGVQALVAELLTNGYELRVRAAHARSLDQLRRELSLAVAESGAAVGVSIFRADGNATAWLCRPSACEKLEADAADGELSRSRLALAVVEHLRPIDLPGPSLPPLREPPAAVDAGAPRVAPARRQTGALRIWAGAGGALSPGLSAPLSWVSASLGATISAPWAIEGGFAGSPLAGGAETQSGSLSVRALEAVAYAMFEPFSSRRLGVGLGLGGGALHFRERASPAAGFDGFSRSANVALLGARARVYYRTGSVYWGLSVDPGMLVPALKIEAGTETVLRIGRPWVALQATLGVAL